MLRHSSRPGRLMLRLPVTVTATMTAARRPGADSMTRDEVIILTRELQVTGKIERRLSGPVHHRRPRRLSQVGGSAAPPGPPRAASGRRRPPTARGPGPARPRAPSARGVATLPTQLLGLTQ